MADCCSGGVCIPPNKRACPGDKHPCAEVGIGTLLHHLQAPWQKSLNEQRYYFCDNPTCEVVYFGENGDTYTMRDLRHPIGQKQTGAERTLCYCFGVTVADFRADPHTKDFVAAQTKLGLCACETRNPSGRCCLKDFPKD